MRKSGWTVAAGLGSLLLLLTACGGSSSSTSTTGAATGAATQGTASSSSSSGPAGSSTSPTSSAHAQATSSSSSKPEAGGQPSSSVSFPPIGTTIFIIQRSSVGWVMAKANEIVVYTYAKDSKGGRPTCTGSCASVWAPVTGVPMAGPADSFPGTFGRVTGAGGVKQITYNGYPLYTLVGAPVFSTKGDGLEGMWHVIKLSAGDITGG